MPSLSQIGGGGLSHQCGDVLVLSKLSKLVPQVRAVFRQNICIIYIHAANSSEDNTDQKAL